MSLSCNVVGDREKDLTGIKTGIVIIREKSWSWTGIFFVVLKPLTINRLPSLFLYHSKRGIKVYVLRSIFGGWCCSYLLKIGAKIFISGCQIMSWKFYVLIIMAGWCRLLISKSQNSCFFVEMSLRFSMEEIFTFKNNIIYYA